MSIEVRNLFATILGIAWRVDSYTLLHMQINIVVRLLSANIWPKTKGIDGSVQSSHHEIATSADCLFMASATNNTHGASNVRVRPWKAPLSIAAESQV